MGTSDGLNHIVKEACRFSDMAVLPRPNRARHETEAMFDAVLFGTALPILLCNGPDAPACKRVIIAWDGSDQALVATRAALPLLRQAQAVSIVMVDPPHSSAGRFAPGECLATFLSRHDIDCDIDLLPRMKERTSDVLKQHLRDSQSDLLVMGAYGHSRLRESLLGGVTHELMQSSDVPLFLAR
jgi:nucleotide-binding universal stress UspA family protein